MPGQVLIVEDDELIGSSLARALAAGDYDVELVATLTAAGRAVARRRPDLVLCDLGLPDGDGLVLVERLRLEHPEVPVLVLTARDDEADVVAGLSSGAVDYVTKPFRLAELLARVAAQLRQRAAADARDRDHLVVGDLEIRVDARRVLVGGAEVALRPKEFDLLARLGADAGRVVRREDLMADVWDEHWWGPTKTLDVHISALRKKLGAQPWITTLRGVGYRLDAPDGGDDVTLVGHA